MTLPREANYVGQNQSMALTPAQTRRIGHKTGEHGLLSSGQFMPMNQIKRVRAVDSVPGNAPDQSVASLIPRKIRQMDRGEGQTADYPAMKQAMKTGGPLAVPPIYLRSVYGGEPELGDKPEQMELGNGGHRVAAASQLGWKAMSVTSNREESGYADNRFDGGRIPEDSDMGSSNGSLSSAQFAAANIRDRG